MELQKAFQHYSLEITSGNFYGSCLVVLCIRQDDVSPWLLFVVIVINIIIVNISIIVDAVNLLLVAVKKVEEEQVCDVCEIKLFA